MLDSGEGVTHAVPIYEGYAIPHAIQTIQLSGKDLTDYLQQLVKEKQTNSSFWDYEEIKKMKEKTCYVA